MKRVTVTFTTAELTLLSSLATDQLFRREFIDPRLPGYRSNGAEIALGKQLVERLRLLTDPGHRDDAHRTEHHDSSKCPG
jgi:hypothetical protein